MRGKLYIVSTPIGNYEDITLRALNILKTADIIICEEVKEARRLLSNYNIEKELIPLNEHNENIESIEIASRISNNNLLAALISDCGTPIFSDPGGLLLKLCLTMEVEIRVIPGANSLIAALSGSGLNINRFYYYGWLSQKRDIRKRELKKLKNVKEIIILMEAPYRLKTILKEISEYFGKKKEIIIAFQITMQNEKFYRGEAWQLYELAVKENLKGEFILIIDNSMEGG